MDWLGDKAVHPNCVVEFNLVGHDIGRDGDNRRTHALLVGLKLPDNAGRLDTVHLRHLNIHQDEIEKACTPGFDGLFAVLNEGWLNADLVQQGPQDTSVDVIVFCCEHAPMTGWRRLIHDGDLNRHRPLR